MSEIQCCKMLNLILLKKMFIHSLDISISLIIISFKYSHVIKVSSNKNINLHDLMIIVIKLIPTH